jgi:hypothetical protein
MCFEFIYNFETFLILGRIRRHTVINIHSARYSCQIVMKLEFSRQIFEKSTNIKFHENPSCGSRVVACGRTDGHDEANIRYSQFYESA